MPRISVLIDLGGEYVAHDVYGLWVEACGETILIGWDDYHGGQHACSTGSQSNPLSLFPSCSVSKDETKQDGGTRGENGNGIPCPVQRTPLRASAA